MKLYYFQLFAIWVKLPFKYSYISVDMCFNMSWTGKLLLGFLGDTINQPLSCWKIAIFSKSYPKQWSFPFNWKFLSKYKCNITMKQLNLMFNENHCSNVCVYVRVSVCVSIFMWICVIVFTGMCSGVHACVYMCSSLWVCKPELDVMCIPQFLTTLYFSRFILILIIYVCEYVPLYVVAQVGQRRALDLHRTTNGCDCWALETEFWLSIRAAIALNFWAFSQANHLHWETGFSPNLELKIWIRWPMISKDPLESMPTLCTTTEVPEVYHSTWDFYMHARDLNSQNVTDWAIFSASLLIFYHCNFISLSLYIVHSIHLF